MHQKERRKNRVTSGPFQTVFYVERIITIVVVIIYLAHIHTRGIFGDRNHVKKSPQIFVANEKLSEMSERSSENE